MLGELSVEWLSITARGTLISFEDMLVYNDYSSFIAREENR